MATPQTLELDGESRPAVTALDDQLHLNGGSNGPGAAGASRAGVDALLGEIRACKRSGDWTGDGARPVTADACKGAAAVVKHVLSNAHTDLPRAYASPFGAVMLVWRLRGGFLSFFVKGSNAGPLEYQWAGDDFRSEAGHTSLPEASALLKRFAE